jgi:hypothetical protein
MLDEESGVATFWLYTLTGQVDAKITHLAST